MVNANGAMPGGFLSVSSKGALNGIIWASTPYNGNALQQTVPGVLHAFDAVTLAELWSDQTNDLRVRSETLPRMCLPLLQMGKYSSRTSAR